MNSTRTAQETVTSPTTKTARLSMLLVLGLAASLSAQPYEVPGADAWVDGTVSSPYGVQFQEPASPESPAAVDPFAGLNQTGSDPTTPADSSAAQAGAAAAETLRAGTDEQVARPVEDSSARSTVVTAPPRPVVQQDPREPARRAIVKAAVNAAGKPFRYAAGTDGGRKGCANVASTLLRRAGIPVTVTLDCWNLVDQLHGANWFDTKAPPYHNGDVIFWASYDWNGDGRIDRDTHVGIVVRKGNTTYVVTNSSELCRPVMVELREMPFRISRVMRMMRNKPNA